MRGPVPFPGAPPAFFPMGGPGRMGYAPQMMPRPRFVAPQGQQPQQGQQRGVPAQGFQNSGTGVGQRVSNRPRNPRPPPGKFITCYLLIIVIIESKRDKAQPSQSGQFASGAKPRSQNAQGQQVSKNYKYTATARNQPDVAGDYYLYFNFYFIA